MCRVCDTPANKTSLRTFLSMRPVQKRFGIRYNKYENPNNALRREPKWQKYHQEVHTLSTDLAKVAQKAKPKLLVTYHRIYHMNIQDNHINLEAEMRRRDDAILDEIRAAGYEGMTVNGRDLEVF